LTSPRVAVAAAAERALLFGLAIFTDPIIFGDYPAVVKANAGPLLPQFTDAQRHMLRGSVDFFALNHYTSRYASQPSYPQPPPGQGFSADQWVNSTAFDASGQPIGPLADSPWLYVAPQFFASMLKWVADRYPGLPIYVTENGRRRPG
jgi:beta-glucosidase/6-phospho-beta-glucosidase/beta-galactosidase